GGNGLGDFRAHAAKEPAGIGLDVPETGNDVALTNGKPAGEAAGLKAAVEELGPGWLARERAQQGQGQPVLPSATEGDDKRDRRSLGEKARHGVSTRCFHAGISSRASTRMVPRPVRKVVSRAVGSVGMSASLGESHAGACAASVYGHFLPARFAYQVPGCVQNRSCTGKPRT